MPVMHSIKSNLAKRVMQRVPFEKMIPKVEKGQGATHKVGAIAKQLGITRALVVTDSILLKLGVVDSTLQSLRDNGLDYTLFDGVLPDPTVGQVLDGAKLYINESCDGIIAIGGGSSMDCAKVIGAYVKDPKDIAKFEGGMNVPKGIPPLIAIPTTAGTGSETTFAAVITDGDRKFLVTDFKLFPKYAILDPELTLGLPPAVTAATGMDALTHAVESYLSPWATPFSLEKSEQAVKAILEFLPRVYNNGQDLDARMELLQASFNAGITVSVAAVGYVHAIAHQLGGIFHTPHGIANAMVLPHVLEFYGSAAVDKLANLATLCGLSGDSSPPHVASQAFVDKVKGLLVELNMPTRVDEMQKKDISRVVTRALEEAHGERKSMLFEFPSFMKDCGYPTIKHMDAENCAGILRKLVPSSRL